MRVGNGSTFRLASLLLAAFSRSVHTTSQLTLCFPWVSEIHLLCNGCVVAHRKIDSQAGCVTKTGETHGSGEKENRDPTCCYLQSETVVKETLVSWIQVHSAIIHVSPDLLIICFDVTTADIESSI